MIDSSALIAILLGEPEADDFAAAILDDPVRLMSSASLLEAGIVAESRLGDPGGHELDMLIHRLGIEIADLDTEQVNEGRRAWRRFGKGNHADRLNFGDLCVCGLASALEEPLLFKGDDFAATDLAPALRR
ncbi:MAG: type II toxin-antitoxin system VapC family toxin [Solirubrobacterales bacterium]|nr:type II toxin-antitoxin system VapC family toxin [Solirubrobacterales bacterium]